jgi:hypothetical protein
MTNHEIEDFWLRFENHFKLLGSDPYEAEFIKFIDDTILHWGLMWEIGPGKSKEFSFTISPQGNFDLIEKANQIISKAPVLEDWEYYGFKQPKENWHLANLLDRNIAVNAINWTHQLLQYPEGDFELLIKADNIRQYDTGGRDLIVDLVVTNLLGEEIKMNEIVHIEIVDDFEDSKGTTKLEYLPFQIAHAKNSN